VILLEDNREYPDFGLTMYLMHESGIATAGVQRQPCVECRGSDCTHLSEEETQLLDNMKKLAGAWVSREASPENPNTDAHRQGWFQGSPLQQNDTIAFLPSPNFSRGSVSHSRPFSDDHNNLSYWFEGGRLFVDLSIEEVIYDYSFKIADDELLLLSSNDTIRLVRSRSQELLSR
jgi:hypothetical protein